MTHAADLDAFAAFCRDELHIAQDLRSAFADYYGPLAEQIAARQSQGGGMLVVGVSGSQASGKTTIARILRWALERGGRRVVAMSIDDLYLSWSARRSLQAAHPDNPYYQVSRGNPGTHDIALGVEVINALRAAGPDTVTAIPAFDKAEHDGKGDLLPRASWPRVTGRPDVFILEGWCVGLRRLPAETIERLIANVPEALAYRRAQDPTGRHGALVNDRLTEYEPLFDLIDHLVFLKIPHVGKIVEWRTKQERELRAQRGSGMTDAQVAAFIGPYLFLTGVHSLQGLGDCASGLADTIIELGEDQQPRARIDCACS